MKRFAVRSATFAALEATMQNHATKFDMAPGPIQPPSRGAVVGNLRLSGKLVTNPGATFTDSVFEPSYKLALLSQVGS